MVKPRGKKQDKDLSLACIAKQKGLAKKSVCWNKEKEIKRPLIMAERELRVEYAQKKKEDDAKKKREQYAQKKMEEYAKKEELSQKKKEEEQRKKEHELLKRPKRTSRNKLVPLKDITKGK